MYFLLISYPLLPTSDPHHPLKPQLFILGVYSLLSSMVSPQVWNQRNPSKGHRPPTISFGFQGQGIKKNAMNTSSCYGQPHFAPAAQREWRFPGQSSFIRVLYVLPTSPQNQIPKRGLGNSKLVASREDKNWDRPIRCSSLTHLDGDSSKESLDLQKPPKRRFLRLLIYYIILKSGRGRRPLLF